MKVVDGEGRSIADPRFNVDIQNYATIASARPLAAGVYKFYEHEQFPYEMPCNFIHPESELPTIRVTVAAPAAAIHEAFFDPVNLTNGIGADKDNGVLKPTSFTVNAAAEIERIAWMPSGAVEIDFKPSVSLSGHVIEFIGLDGKPALSLDFDQNAGTSSAPSWRVCDQPWKAGDLLMIRISEGASTANAGDYRHSC